MVAQSGTSITPLSTSPREMCYTEGFQDFKAAVLALHQTPPVAVGLQEPGAYAAYNASMKAWRHAAIQPLCDILAESDTEFLAPQFGSGLTVEIESDSVDDTDLIEQQLQNDLAAKVRTKNEWRAVRGMSPLPGPLGDEFAGTEHNPSASAATGDVDKPVASSQTHSTGKKSLEAEADVSHGEGQMRAGLIAEILYGIFGKSALAFFNDLQGPDEKSFDPSKHPHDERGRWASTGAATNVATVRDQVASALNGQRVTSDVFTNVVRNLSALSTDDLNRLHREHGYVPAPSVRSHLLRSVVGRLNQLHLPNADRSAFRSASVSGGVEVFVQHEDELHRQLTPFDANQKRPNLSHEQWGDIVGAQPSARVYVYPNMGDVEIFVDHPDYRSKRRLSRSGLIENVEMRISPRARHSGLATRIFAKQVESAIGLGFRSIECGASGQGTMVRVQEDLYPYRHPKWGGYYAWGRLGFDGDISELMMSRKSSPSAHLRGIADDFYATFPAVKRVSQLMKTPEGRDWWQKFGGYFNGVFNLKKGSLSRRVLSEYLAEKATGSKPKSLETPLDEPETDTTCIEEPAWLTADDEAILDRIWDRIGQKPVQGAEAPTDVETPEV